MRKLPIGPEEAFVLSRVDGRTSETDIAAATGLEPGRVRETLHRLAELGAIEYAAPDPEPRPSATPHAAPRIGHVLDHPVIEAPGSTPTDHMHPAAALYDPAELDEDVDLDLPRKRRILDLFYRLDSQNHYQLLEIAPDAGKKEIKDAYFQAVTMFHPDRYFGKNLGDFKPKLEKIFGRFTDAHDVLTKKHAREEYDGYLARQQRNEALTRMLDDERARDAEIERVRRQIEEQARISERAEHVGTQSSNPPAGASSSTPPRPLDPEARRKALARKLGRNSGRPPSPSIPPPQSPREQVAEDLRRRYDERVLGIKKQQIDRYMDAAEQSLQDGNAVSAANALRIAASLAPDDLALAAKLESVQETANRELSQSYLDQAQYEERSGHFDEAARSYERAASGRSSAKLLERAAHCLLEAKGDVRKASDLARQAVQLAPNQADLRVTLARVYVTAGMRQSALGELERATALAPGDDSIKDWIRRIKRGEV